LRFYIVDVFAESRFSGNQLAVFRDTRGITTEQMQKIAQEMHYSETTFIISEEARNGGYDVRVFTPAFELPFAGHPTLGTAFIIQSQIIGEPVETVTLNMKVGQIPVTFSYADGRPGILWMRQKEPTFGRRFEQRRMTKLLGLSSSDLDKEFPVLQVSTGIPFIIVPLRSLRAVKGVRIAQEGASALLKTSKSTGILVFSRETYSQKNDLNVRVLGVAPEIPEDPATGSGNGCLAAYLAKTGYLGQKQVVNARVEQGYEIGRKSLLLLNAERKDGRIEVNVGGRVQFIAKGEFPDE
jgi:trans-2,3-dihydro-3-hydroxyanthranilate isomerase